MNKPTELMLVNQMITNNLLKNILAATISNNRVITTACANQLDEITDDMVISHNKFKKLIKE